MKTLLVLLLLPTVSFAWTRRDSDDQILDYMKWGAFYELGYNFQQDAFYGAKPGTIKRNKVGTVKTYYLKENGKKTSWYERTFDTSGRLIKMKYKGDVVDYTFTDTLLTEIQRTTKNTFFDTKIIYDSQSRVVKISFFKNKKLTGETNYSYFDQEKTSLVEKKIYGKKTKVYRLETDYDNILKTASESRYVIDGELKKRWTYSCDQKGKVEEKKVAEVTQCNYSASNNDGSYINYSRTIEDGKDYLQESTYSKDSVIMEYKRFLHDSILVSHSTFSKNKNIFESFSKKGKLEYRSVIEKDDRGNTLKYAYYKKKGKTIFDTSYRYNENELIQEVTYSSGRKVQFEYSYL